MKTFFAWLAGGVMLLQAQIPVKTGVQSFSLPNGLRVVLLEDHSTPLIRASLRLAWDPDEEPTEKAGLGSFLGLLLEGAVTGLQPRSGLEAFPGHAAVRLHFQHSPRHLEWTASAGSSEQEAALQAMARLVQRPALDGPYVESLRLNQWQILEAQTPLQPLRTVFLLSLDRQRTFDLDSLSRLGLNDLDSFYRNVCRPERGVLGLSGDLSLPQAKALALLHLGAWGRSADRLTPGKHLTRRLVHHPEGAPEAWIGLPARTFSPKDRARSEMLARMLDGLPERKGAPGGLMCLKTSAVTPEQLLTQIQSALARWEGLPDAWTPAQLAAARLRWHQEEALTALHPSRAMEQALDRSLGFAAQPSEIDPITLEEMRAFFRESLAQAQLLVSGVSQATLRRWVQEESILARWRDQMEMPKRDAKSK